MLDDSEDDDMRSKRPRRRFRVTPSLVLSTAALFVALAGTGVAADVVPLAKRALTADKAKTANTTKVARDALKLNGLTATQIAAMPGLGTNANTLGGQTAAQIAATPGPVSSVSGTLLTLRTNSWELDFENQIMRVTAECQSGERAVGGGWTQSEGHGEVLQKSPNADWTGWRFSIWAESGDDLPASGTAYAICLKVS